jgi:hypothetical protein
MTLSHAGGKVGRSYLDEEDDDQFFLGVDANLL